MAKFCGLDFGTSNSTLGSVYQNKPILLPLEKDKVTIPTAIFYHFEDNCPYFGRDGINEYIDGEFGRLLRSLKSVLGTSLMAEKTQIKTQQIAFTDIISTFLTHIKKQAETRNEHTFEQVVLGRPVHFIDDDKSADLLAQQTLEQAAQNAGFKEVLFQYEPIAAALDYEQQISSEEIAFIVDIGGGTADFSIVKMRPGQQQKADRKDDILANSGVHIGGTDFDKKLSLATAMPLLGYNSLFKPKKMRINYDSKHSIRKSVEQDLIEESNQIVMPSIYYHNLATWHKIHYLYDKSCINALKDLAYQVENKNHIDRLLTLINQRDGHRLAIDIEQVKMALTQANKAYLCLDFIEPLLGIEIQQQSFDDAIHAELERLHKQMQATLDQASLSPAQITKVFLTGGSTAIPAVQQLIRKLFTQAPIIQGDTFGSVGLGLAIDASRKFR